VAGGRRRRLRSGHRPARKPAHAGLAAHRARALGGARDRGPVRTLRRTARAALPPILEKLPRPLWISAYDSDGVGAAEFAGWLASWLPRDVGVLFQDGVGVHARSAPVAREYADALAARLGEARVGLIAEAFREHAGRFRPATADELKSQLAAYRGLPIYLFDGPHYVPEAVVRELAR
jgi:hypothetical protein